MAKDFLPVRAALRSNLDDARRRSREKYKERHRQEAGDESADELSEVLGDGLGTDEMTSLQITSKIGSLCCSSGGDHTAKQVDPDGMDVAASGGIDAIEILTMGSTSDNELSCLSTGRDWIDVRDTGGEDTDEAEQECENDSKDGKTDVDAKADTLHNAGDDNTGNSDWDPDIPADLVFEWRRIDDRGVSIRFDGVLAASCADLVPDTVDHGSDTGSDGAPFDSELYECGDQHD